MVGFTLLSRSYYYLRRRSPGPPFPPDHRQAGERWAIKSAFEDSISKAFSLLIIIICFIGLSPFPFSVRFLFSLLLRVRLSLCCLSRATSDVRVRLRDLPWAPRHIAHGARRTVWCGGAGGIRGKHAVATRTMCAHKMREKLPPCEAPCMYTLCKLFPVRRGLGLTSMTVLDSSRGSRPMRDVSARMTADPVANPLTFIAAAR